MVLGADVHLDPSNDSNGSLASILQRAVRGCEIVDLFRRVSANSGSPAYAENDFWTSALHRLVSTSGLMLVACILDSITCQKDLLSIL